MLNKSLATPEAQRKAQIRLLQEHGQLPGEVFGAPGLKGPSALPVFDYFAQPVGSGCQYGDAGPHAFECYQIEALFPVHGFRPVLRFRKRGMFNRGYNDKIGLRQQVGHIAAITQKLHRQAGRFFSYNGLVPRFPAFARYVQFEFPAQYCGQQIQGVELHVQPLFRRNGACIHQTKSRCLTPAKPRPGIFQCVVNQSYIFG